MTRISADPLEPLVTAFHARTPIRAWSLIVTLFGDVVAPRGGEIGMQAITQILAALGLSGSVIRTAMSRLASDGWVERVRDGRLSFYKLSAQGWDEVRAAAPVIYGGNRDRWDGRLDIVVVPDNAMGQAARSALLLRGFALLAANVLWAPASEKTATRLSDLRDRCPDAIVLGAQPVDKLPPAIIAKSWRLDALGEAYRAVGFLLAPLAAAPPSDPIDALSARLLTIHHFRRVVLRDPGLPAALYPEPWPGVEARQIVSDIYRGVAEPSEFWLEQHATCSHGPLPPPLLDLRERFINGAGNEWTGQPLRSKIGAAE